MAYIKQTNKQTSERFVLIYLFKNHFIKQIILYINIYMCCILSFFFESSMYTHTYKIGKNNNLRDCKVGFFFQKL